MNKYISYDDKIFVAGAHGMAGSAICRSLLKAGYGKKGKGSILLRPNRKELNLLCGKSVNFWFRENKPSVVIIAAAKVGGILSNSSFPTDFLIKNIKIQTNIFESCLETKVKRILFLGSSCIYPRNAAQPIIEEYLLSGPLEKTNEHYAIAKIAGIKLCEALCKQHNIDAISLMPTNLYGPGDNYHEKNSHVMPALIKKIHDSKKFNIPKVKFWGTGNPRREFLHVDDLADAAIFVLKNISSDNKLLEDKNSKYQGILNIGTGEDISIKQLAEKICEEQKYNGEITWDKNKPDGTPRKLLDVSKIKKLGWKAKISLSKGIKNTIKSFLEESKNQSIRL